MREAETAGPDQDAPGLPQWLSGCNVKSYAIAAGVPCREPPETNGGLILIGDLREDHPDPALDTRLQKYPRNCRRYPGKGCPENFRGYPEKRCPEKWLR